MGYIAEELDEEGVAVEKRRLAAITLAGALLLSPGALAACDREDQKDVEETVEDADKELDKLDTDGKDD